MSAGTLLAGPGSAKSRARAGPPPWLQAAVLFVLVAFVYARVAVSLWQTWMTNENYEHGPLVPLVAVWLVWRKRAELRATPVAPDARGLAVVALACAMEVFGLRADLFALQGWSLPLLLAGLSLTFLGGARTRVLAFPIAWLAFMLTFPPVLMNQLSYALKEIALQLATVGAKACGVALQRSGMTLQLLTGELRVENPCSGLRSLLALLATGALFAHLQPGAMWRRVLVFLAAVPIAIFGNAVRLWLLVVASHYRDVNWATGRFHDVAGYILFAVALTLLMAARAALTPRPAGPEAS